MLNLIEPTSTGVGADVFAVIYIASENKLHFLNASGTAPTGATLQRYNSLGYFWNPNNFAFGSGMPRGILSVTVPGAAWGWDEMQTRFGNLTFKETLQPAIDHAENGVPIQERVANFNLPNALGPFLLARQLLYAEGSGLRRRLAAIQRKRPCARPGIP